MKIENKWRAEVAKGMTEPELLRYRSNLLGSDLALTNFAGGNTSAKCLQEDPLTGADVEVLWVKGSGGDLGSMGLDGFSTLYLDKLFSLQGRYRGIEHEDEMVDLLAFCTYRNNPRAASIDTPLHAFIPKKHIDHLHPDSVIAIAAAADGPEITKKVYGDEIGWIPWQRPGFDLALKLKAEFLRNPACKGIILGGHGLFTWGDTSYECYENTLEIIQKATDYLEKNATGSPFGGPRVTALGTAERRRCAEALMPLLRRGVSTDNPKIGHFTDAPEVLEFVCSQRFLELSALGTSCPDHFLRTKIRPFTLDITPAEIPSSPEQLEHLFNDYREAYRAYYQRCSRPDSPPMRDPNPVIILVPAVGLFSFASDKSTARVAAEFYVNAINVMRGATSVSQYVGLPEQEAFDIEYWSLEEAKLRRMPKPKMLAGKIALITGGAGGIGRATAHRLAAEGACIMLLDRDADALAKVKEELAVRYGQDVVRAAQCDVTAPTQIEAAFATCIQEFGGIDILVANAGIASSASIDETDLNLWEKNYSVLVRGYFLSTQAAVRVMKTQQSGSIIFIGSKNALSATLNASAYASAKAASVHLARCVALEGASFGVRVNVVNPDAVIRGSRIWDGNWRQERAAAYNIDAGQELEEHYRSRSLLKKSVFPEDVAEAVYFFAADLSGKSTGNIINVDAGNATAFTR